MPALNEEKNIKSAVEDSFKATDFFCINSEVIVINDGSKDNTPVIVEKLKKDYPDLRMITHKSPMGIGHSFWDGVQNADGEVVVMFPGDNENDPYETLQYFDLMNRVDIIVPYIFNKNVRHLLRRLISRIYRFIINFSFGINLNYTNGTVMYRKCVFDNIKLESKGFFYQAELLIKTIRTGYIFAEVPCSLGQRSSGKSKAVSLKSMLRVMKGYLRMFFKLHLRIIGHGKISKDSISYQKRSFTYNYIKNKD